MNAVAEGDYLHAISLIESRDEDREKFSDIRGMLYSFVGDWERADKLRPSAARKYEVSVPNDFQLTPALEAIAREAHGRQLVIINEAHDAPEHRAFIARLAEILRKDGFSFYAIETLSEDPRALSQRGFPLIPTGFYSCEPRFGDLVRDVLRLGFTPVSYEEEDVKEFNNPIESINAREQSQCRNLVQRVFSKNPKARLLVHVGLDHVMEQRRKVDGDEISWLAARLKQATGIDPLTIDQITQLRPPHDGHTQPAVALNAQGQTFVGGPYRGFVDVQVYHPPTKTVTGRPNWLLSDKSRRVVEIPSELEAGSARVLVQAFYANEGPNAVPADQVLLDPGGLRPALSLRPGSYRIVSQDESGNRTAIKQIDVD